jgi:hypothetical protein
MTSLANLVKDAKQTPEAAERELLPILREVFPELGVAKLAINTGSEVSLNSINGILTTKDNRRLFFKFHAEEGETQSLVGGEYYRAELLADLGWNVIKPIAVSTKPGRQCLVYEERRDPTAYDVFGEQDDFFLRTGKYDDGTVKSLLAAEEEYLKKATEIMIRTLEPAAPETAKAPLFQLFSHRLIGAGGAVPRVDLFYTGKQVTLPDGKQIAFEDIALRKWVVNGREMPETLAAILALAKKYLAVEELIKGPAVISHGDDHNGNKFFSGGEFIAFDPAFAGRHPALLAPIKGTMHNGPLHPFWYYKPARVQGLFKVSCSIGAERLEVTHNADKILASPLREQIVRLHIDYAWRPLLQELQRRELLHDNWRMIVKCAAFCCPFLAVNMIDAGRLPAYPQLSVFNLLKCVEAFHAAEWEALRSA